VNEQATLTVLLGTAFTVAVGHTLIGIDHTLPFVVLGRARSWSLRKVLGVTALCGAGHVLSSVLLGLCALALGTALTSVEWLQTARGEVAAWLLIAFGSFFAVRGLVRTLRAHDHHSHPHAHEGGVIHEHPHDHGHVNHVHPHALPSARATTVWTLFIIFVLGPCEPLVPLMLAPAALHDVWGVLLVVSVFGAATIAAMVLVVTAAYLGLGRVSLPYVQRHAEFFAGLAIALSGVAIQTLGI
jgi:nickel/cobalt transporter (NicO) family protein